MFSIVLLLAGGVGGHLQTPTPLLPPPFTSALSLEQTSNKHTGCYCFSNSTLRALRFAFSCIPLSFLLSNSFLLHYFSFSLFFFKIRERCGRSTLAAARFLLSNVPL